MSRATHVERAEAPRTAQLEPRRLGLRERRPTRAAAAVAVAVALSAAAAPPALAGGTLSHAEGDVQYVGDAAANRVTASTVTEGSTRWVVVRDDAGPIAAAEGCEALSDGAARCALRSGEDVEADLDGGGGDDELDASGVAGTWSKGGAGDDVVRGAGILSGGKGDDELVATGATNLNGNTGADRMTGSDADDIVTTDAEDTAIDLRAGDDLVFARLLPAALIACGAGQDGLYPRPTLPEEVDPTGGPLLAPDCEEVDNVAARPFVVRDGVVTFTVRCASGEMDFADYRCRSRLSLRTPSGTLAARDFRARNASAVKLAFPLKGGLRRAFDRHAVVTIEIAGFRQVASDFDKEDRGSLLWRVAL